MCIRDSLDSDRSEFAAVDLGVELKGLRDRAESLAWQQPLGAELEEGSAFQGSWYLMLPQDVTPIGFDANQCAYSDQVLQCAADSGQSVSVQLLAEASGIREIALYGVQEGGDGSHLKEINATNNLKILRFNVSEDSDQDSLPDDYERCLLYTSPSPRDATLSRMPSSA